MDRRDFLTGLTAAFATTSVPAIAKDEKFEKIPQLTNHYKIGDINCFHLKFKENESFKFKFKDRLFEFKYIKEHDMLFASATKLSTSFYKEHYFLLSRRNRIKEWSLKSNSEIVQWLVAEINSPALKEKEPFLDDEEIENYRKGIAFHILIDDGTDFNDNKMTCFVITEVLD